MEHLEQTLATCMYSHCNICNISIYFCYIHVKQLKHTSKTLENICLQHAISAKTWHGRVGGALHSGDPALGRSGEGGCQWAARCTSPLSGWTPPSSGTRGGGGMQPPAVSPPRIEEGCGERPRGGEGEWQGATRWRRPRRQDGAVNFAIGD
jgi:hypothetical protein